jgi:hypothetical protein
LASKQLHPKNQSGILENKRTPPYLAPNDPDLQQRFFIFWHGPSVVMGIGRGFQ